MSLIPPIFIDAVSDQTKRPRIIFEENSGLATVVPVDFIVETVELASQVLTSRGRVRQVSVDATSGTSEPVA